MKKWFLAMAIFLLICFPAFADVFIPPEWYNRITPSPAETASPSPDSENSGGEYHSPNPVQTETPNALPDPENPGGEQYAPTPAQTGAPNALPDSENSGEEPSGTEPAESETPSPLPESFSPGGQSLLTAPNMLIIAAVLVFLSIILWKAIRAHKAEQ